MSEKNISQILYLDEGMGKPTGLKGTHCSNCNRITLGNSMVCSYCASSKVELVCIGKKARIINYSVVNQSSGIFEAPYAIALIETEEGPKTFAPIETNHLENLKKDLNLNFKIYQSNDSINFAYQVEEEV